MDVKQRENFVKWMDKWRDVDFVSNWAASAGICLTNIPAIVEFFDGPLRVAGMLAIQDPESGVLDMQTWFARIEHEAKYGNTVLRTL